MLTPKGILQIDATVIAGILILLTLVSIEPQTPHEEKMEKWFVDMEQLRNDQMALIEEVVKDSPTISQEEMEQESGRIEKELSRLKEAFVQLEPDLEALKLRKDVRFLIQPQDWIFYGGVGFTISAFFAIIGSLFETKLNTKKPYRFFVGISVIGMLFGFGSLSFIFFKIGGMY